MNKIFFFKGNIEKYNLPYNYMYILMKKWDLADSKIGDTIFPLIKPISKMH